MNIMKKETLEKILDDIGSVKIAVAGDFCLDSYWFIDESMSEISVETNLATRPVRQQRYSLGGAGNVTSNLAVMGIRDVRAFGVIGPDPFGAEMIRIMKETGIQTRNLIVQEENWYTHTYAKPYTGDLELNRVDFGNYNRLSEQTADRLINNLTLEIPEVDIVLINRPDLPPGGAGEPSSRATAAAIGNAVFDATGVRIRRIPLTPENVKAALAAV